MTSDTRNTYAAAHICLATEQNAMLWAFVERFIVAYNAQGVQGEIRSKLPTWDSLRSQAEMLMATKPQRNTT